jgi:hypothetical protein
VLGEHVADRLDPEALLVRVDVVADQRSRRSVKSARGAVSASRPVRFPGPLPEPGMHLSMHRALHKPPIRRPDGPPRWSARERG